MRTIVSDMRATARTKVVINRVGRANNAYLGYARETAEGLGELVAVFNEDGATPELWRKLASALIEQK
jgi:hypothetical protein